MGRIRWGLAVCCCGLVCTAAFSQASPQPAAPPQQPPTAGAKAPDYSKEPVVIERMSTEYVLQKDGTSTQATAVRARVQSPAGVQQFGLLRVLYASATSSLEIVSVRVLKPDGRVVVTPAETALEMPTDITRAAPFYSDLKEKQVAVKGLAAGDTLEYAFVARVHSPLDPRQFWVSYEFTKKAIVLEEQLQFEAPRDKYVKIWSPNLQPVTRDEGDFRVFIWKTSNLEHKPEAKPATTATPRPESPPDVLVSTFRSWEEVGEWFRSLLAPRAEPTAEIRTKAQELMRGATTDEQKIRAIYGYVSSKFRYIGVSLGIGRYQPHAAAEVLANEYGDCKDKHTLLASLLAAVGVKIGAALVNSAVKIDPEVPSPGQFDHVVSVASAGQRLGWMDTTTEVAPLGYLVPQIRGSQALLIPTSGPARLVETPAELPFLSVVDFQMDGALNDEGTFTGKAQLSLRGDLEVLLRTAFRQAGQPEWNDLMQKISGNLGFGGTVSEVTADAPEATETAFHIRYQYQRKEYGDWPNRRIPAPLPVMYLPEPPAETEKNPEPVDLGNPVEFSLRSDMKLPEGSTPQVPHPRSNDQEFAHYSSKASFSKGILHVERTLSEKTRQVQPGQLENYRKFRKEVIEEWTSMIPLREGATEAAIASSDNPEANDAYEKGSDAEQRSSLDEAIRWFHIAVEKDPKFAAAWFDLGMAHFNLGVLTDAATEMSKAIALNPALAGRGKLAAQKMMQFRRLPEALELWRAVAKANPQDTEAVKAIARILLEQHRYAEAVPELEAAVAGGAKDPGLEYSLAHALLASGKKDQAMEHLNKAVELDDSPRRLNSAAYLLAEQDFQLEQAKTWAEKAVAALESRTKDISLEKLTLQDLVAVGHLGPYWDTLGWVYFRMGRFDTAEKYLGAAWSLSEDAVIGDHLGQVLEKQGKKREAARIYARTVATNRAPEETGPRLIRLLGTPALAQRAIAEAAGELSRMRSVKLPILSKESISAEFYVLFERGAGVKAARFIAGEESLREATKALLEAKYDIAFPDEAPTRIVRRGVLACQHEPAGCLFVMIGTSDARMQVPPPPAEARVKIPPAEESSPAPAGAPPRAASNVPSSGPWLSVSLPFRPVRVTASGTDFWVCGTDEGIAVSLDAGNSWQIKHSTENGEVLLQITALSKRMVYAAGTHGLLLWSKDGGETWTSQTTGAETVQRISFGDEKHGIREAGGRVETTADGGTHWAPVSALETDEKARAFTEILGVAALDAARMAVTLHQPQGENGFFATRDGGATWKFIHLEDTFDGMLFVRGGEYWAFGTEYVNRQERGGYGVGGAVHSKDGENWTHAPHSPHEFSACTAQGCYVWDGALVDLSAEGPRFWSTPQDGSLTQDWAIAQGVVCSVGGAMKCSPVAVVEEPPERPEEDRPVLIAINQQKLMPDCLRCEFPSFPADLDAPLTITVGLDFLIRKDGTAGEVEISNTPGPRIADPIRKQVELFLFVPPRAGGAPLVKRVHIDVGLYCDVFAGHEHASCQVFRGSQPVGISN